MNASGENGENGLKMSDNVIAALPRVGDERRQRCQDL